MKITIEFITYKDYKPLEVCVKKMSSEFYSIIHFCLGLW